MTAAWPWPRPVISNSCHFAVGMHVALRWPADHHAEDGPGAAPVHGRFAHRDRGGALLAFHAEARFLRQVAQRAVGIADHQVAAPRQCRHAGQMVGEGRHAAGERVALRRYLGDEQDRCRHRGRRNGRRRDPHGRCRCGRPCGRRCLRGRRLDMGGVVRTASGEQRSHREQGQQRSLRKQVENGHPVGSRWETSTSTVCDIATICIARIGVPRHPPVAAGRLYLSATPA